MAIAERLYLEEVPMAKKKIDKGIRIEVVEKEDGKRHLLYVVSFRNHKHADFVVDELVNDSPTAFHGWGVSGVAKRVDQNANYKAFWFYKEGRPLGAKIPLLEPPQYAVEHIDWHSVHPDYRYLSDPRRLAELWRGVFPYHIIFPYKSSGNTLSEAVITPAFDKDTALNTPVPTVCFFWVEDPALRHLVRKVKEKNPEAQIAVSSLNDSGQEPPYNTVELIAALKEKKITHYKVVVEDPLLEPLDIASSHSQFIIPLEGEEPVWVMKRRGSLSAKGFEKLTGFPVRVPEGVKVASRRASKEIELDSKLYEASKLIHEWHRGRYSRLIRESIEDLKAHLHLV